MGVPRVDDHGLAVGDAELAAQLGIGGVRGEQVRLVRGPDDLGGDAVRPELQELVDDDGDPGSAGEEAPHPSRMGERRADRGVVVAVRRQEA